MDLSLVDRSGPSLLAPRPLLRALLVAVFALGAIGAQAETRGEAMLEEWLSTSATGRRYEETREALEALVATADLHGLPSVVLVDRLQEGAAKGAKPDSLVAAGEAELGRLLTAESLLRDAGTHPPPDAERAYRTISLSLRAGLSESALSALFGGAGGSAAGLDRSLTACETLLSLTGLTQLSEEEMVRLGRALIASRVPTAALGSVAAVFAKGRAGKLDDGDTLILVVGTLEKGGGVIQVSGAVGNEVKRRSRDR